MKKTIITAAVTMAAFFIGATINTASSTTETVDDVSTRGISAENGETYYPLLMQVVEVDTGTCIATAESRDGNLWQFMSEDAGIGDLYVCIMSDNGTPQDVSDDEIVTLRFAGEVWEYETQTEV